MKVVSVNFPAELWEQLRHHTFAEATSVSALLNQLAEEHLTAKPAAQKKSLDGAREITANRRRRTDG
jgi:hypothetical protein